MRPNVTPRRQPPLLIFLSLFFGFCLFGVVFLGQLGVPMINARVFIFPMCCEEKKAERNFNSGWK